MGFNKKTVRDIDLKGKTVLLRADYNVPVDQGKVQSDYRIKQSLPTVNYLIKQGCKIVICSHLGRPDGRPNMDYSLKPVAEVLSGLLGKPVGFAEDFKEAGLSVKTLKAGQILLLENLRFSPGEEANDPELAKSLAALADVFVQDGFGVVHRAHASTDAVTKLLPSVAGLLLESEVSAITEAMENPKRPMMAIVGGAKISDKLDVLNRFVDIADFVAVGGAMANTFLKAEHVDVGKSLYEPDEIPLANGILKRARAKAKAGHFVFYLPQDGVVAHATDKNAKTRLVEWDNHVITADVESYPKRPPHTSMEVAKDELILDIGPFSGAFIAGGMQMVNTVIWNGTMGITETPSIIGPVGPFAHGTELIIESMLGQFGHRPFSLVGGGDTAAYIENRGLTKAFDHVSTGGGASMDLMAGKELPGVQSLMDNKK